MALPQRIRSPELIWFLLGLACIFIGLVLVHWIKLSADWLPLYGFIGTLAGVLFLFLSFGWAITKSPLGFLRDAENTYSLSRLQMAAWTWLILSALIAVAVARLWNQDNPAATALNIYIPNNLFLVMGISFFTGAAAPALLSLKTSSAVTPGQLQAARTRMDETNVQSNGQLIERPAGEKPHFGDIVEGEEVGTAGTVDISKVQQLLITALLIGVYFAMLWDMFIHPEQLKAMSEALRASLVDQGSLLCGFANATAANAGHCGTGWAAIPDFPGSLVTLLAVSHGGYLAYKAVPRTAADNSGTAGDASKAVG